jgi:hypothetical protein
MVETLFGAGAPMWAAMPSTGVAFQMPMAVANRQTYAPGLANGLSYGPSPSAAFIGPDATTAMAGVMTAPMLLAAVAMRRGQPQGPTTDQDVEDLLYDAFEVLPGAADVEVRCEGGRATLTGNVQHKRVKRDVGEIAWSIPGLQDVQNNVMITSRRRTRPTAGRETEAPSVAGRKQG